MSRWPLLFCAAPLIASAFPQARAGAWPQATLCVAWFDQVRETRPISPVEPQYAEELPYAGICRYDLTSVSPGQHTIQWALVYPTGETLPNNVVTFTKPNIPTVNGLKP